VIGGWWNYIITLSEMGNINTFEDLEVWQVSHQLTLQLYKTTLTFPKEEQYGIISQIRRAAVSIPNNIAEGFGRYTTKDLIHFLIQARGSAFELRYLIILANDLEYMNVESKTELLNKIESTGKMLNALINSLRKRINTNP
jgi:four helix bundle protein